MCVIDRAIHLHRQITFSFRPKLAANWFSQRYGQSPASFQWKATSFWIVVHVLTKPLNSQSGVLFFWRHDILHWCGNGIAT